MTNELLTMVTNNGFAIAMAIYMVVVNNKTVQQNTEAVTKMIIMLENLTDRIGVGTVE